MLTNSRATMLHYSFPKSCLLSLALIYIQQLPTVFSDETAESRCTTITSFNTGLLMIIPKMYERSDLVPPALLETGADVICMQEYWFERDIKKMLDHVQHIYPHHYSPLHDSIGHLSKDESDLQHQGVNCNSNNEDGSSSEFTCKSQKQDGGTELETSPCSEQESNYFKAELVTCAKEHGCLDMFEQDRDDPGLACLFQWCSAEMKSDLLSSSCMFCTIEAMMDHPDKVHSICSEPVKHNRINAPGLFLLSKRPIKKANYVNFFPDNKLFLHRGYLDTEVEGIGRFLCTHLSANLSVYSEFDLPYENYQRQQRAEMEMLKNTFDNEPHILSGDLNCGPAVVADIASERNLSSDFGDNYAFLMDIGYQDPYIQLDGKCTYCGDNPIVGGAPSTVIDHILYKGQNFVDISAKRALDTTDPLPLSDHYGMTVKLCRP